MGEKDLRLINPEIKELALRMYAEGIAARKIERLLHISHNTVPGLGTLGSGLQSYPSTTCTGSSVVEADEIWTYVGSKNSPSGCVEQ